MRFVLLDRLLELEPGKRLVAAKTFLADDELFADHFPGFPVVPGTLLTEAMGQAGGWLLVETLGTARWPLLVLVERAKFRRLVRPGEELTLEARLGSLHEEDFDVRAEASVNGERVADARLLFHAFPIELADADRGRFESWARETRARLSRGPDA